MRLNLKFQSKVLEPEQRIGSQEKSNEILLNPYQLVPSLKQQTSSGQSRAIHDWLSSSLLLPKYGCSKEEQNEKKNRTMRI